MGSRGALKAPLVEAGAETPGRGFRGAKTSDAGSRAAYVPGRDSTANRLTMGGCREGAWRLPILTSDETAARFVGAEFGSMPMPRHGRRGCNGERAAGALAKICVAGAEP